MAKGKKTGGRQKGTPNKATAAVKEALTEAFDGLGGIPALIKWGRANATEFYKLWSRLLPQEVTGKDGGPIQIEPVQIYIPDNGRAKD
jgi:hypothetical protein